VGGILMEYFAQLFTTNAPIAVGVGGLLWSMKKAWPNLSTQKYWRVLFIFLPFILSILVAFIAFKIGESQKNWLTNGLASGALCHLAYKYARERKKKCREE
jgi:hypothetical protein